MPSSKQRKEKKSNYCECTTSERQVYSFEFSVAWKLESRDESDENRRRDLLALLTILMTMKMKDAMLCSCDRSSENILIA